MLVSAVGACCGAYSESRPSVSRGLWCALVVKGCTQPHFCAYIQLIACMAQWSEKTPSHPPLPGSTPDVSTLFLSGCTHASVTYVFAKGSIGTLADAFELTHSLTCD